MRISMASILVFGLVCASSSAQGAEAIASLHSVQGKVLINAGAGFVVAREASLISNGDAILLGPGATATVFFADGSCSVPLLAKYLTTIKGKALCQTAQLRGSDEGLSIEPVNYMAPAAASTVMPVVVTGTFLVLTATLLTTSILNNGGTEPASLP